MKNRICGILIIIALVGLLSFKVGYEYRNKKIKEDKETTITKKGYFEDGSFICENKVYPVQDPPEWDNGKKVTAVIYTKNDSIIDIYEINDENITYISK